MVVKKRENESLLESFISKGGEVPAEKNLNDETWMTTGLRLPKTLRNRIGENLKNRIGLSMNAWILEAIQEKLNK